ncbi:MAG: hypothetical protein GWO07_14700 [Candidatus Dadabacteria bacterium]|nr:hypothetical protein [Candidatus Dadabacteria bacterium]NIS09960.1 hypothetical protein [Candidatus Dadabacteria bacterium]NIV42954.1 hypothetical protein [Candidatus Dadabacteria bacterium]NIY22935.1 hypothetical protein [Candidatus Dadabacteria bacterium]
MNFSYHTTLRDGEENIIFPELEVIDPANKDWTTRDMGFRSLEGMEEEETIFNSADVEVGTNTCDTNENESFEESGRESEGEEFNQLEIENVKLFDILLISMMKLKKVKKLKPQLNLKNG